MTLNLISKLNTCTGTFLLSNMHKNIFVPHENNKINNDKNQHTFNIFQILSSCDKWYRVQKNMNNELN
jgi:hypothetical protein